MTFYHRLRNACGKLVLFIYFDAGFNSDLHKIVNTVPGYIISVVNCYSVEV